MTFAFFRTIVHDTTLGLNLWLASHLTLHIILITVGSFPSLLLKTNIIKRLFQKWAKNVAGRETLLIIRCRWWNLQHWLSLYSSLNIVKIIFWKLPHAIASSKLCNGCKLFQLDSAFFSFSSFFAVSAPFAFISDPWVLTPESSLQPLKFGGWHVILFIQHLGAMLCFKRGLIITTLYRHFFNAVVSICSLFEHVEVCLCFILVN